MKSPTVVYRSFCKFRFAPSASQDIF